MNIPKFINLYRNDLELKAYADNTIKNYTFQVELFLRKMEVNFTEPSKINEKSIKEWLLETKSVNSRKHRLSALKLFYKLTIHQPLKFRNIEYPRSEKKLPQVIDKDFILERILEIKNNKHKAIICLAFSTGMRVSEIINLKISDIDSKRSLINIIKAKGNKDRIVPLSEKVRLILREYYKEYNPKIYLFNGQFKPTYSSKSCNNIVKKYLGANYHFHTLRHSSFTALLENGTDLRIIQSIAGHSSSKTTEIYTHVSTNLLSKVQLPI